MRLLSIIAVALFALAPSAFATPPTDCFGAPTNDARSSDEADYLTGTQTDDVAALGTGADQYFAWDGDDILCGNEGDDLLVGESGSDQLAGGDGDDHLVGFGGPDVLVAGFGADTLEGDGGSDTLRATAIDGTADDLYDGQGEDVISGGDEDTWHRCIDDTPDDHAEFTGQIVPDPNC